MSAETRTFHAVVAEAGPGGGHWVEIPFDVRAAFGEARAPVAATVAGVPYRSRVAVYGGRTYLGLRKDLLAVAGKVVGDDGEAKRAETRG